MVSSKYLGCKFLKVYTQFTGLPGAGNFPPPQNYSRKYVVKQSIISIIQTSHHLPYKGLKPAHVAVHSYNNRSKVYHGNREVALRAFSTPVKKSKP